MAEDSLAVWVRMVLDTKTINVDQNNSYNMQYVFFVW